MNLTGRDDFDLKLPNEHQPAAVELAAGAEMTFPPSWMTMCIEPIPGHRLDIEAFVVVATKGPLNLPAVLGKREKIPFTEVAAALFGIPTDQRALKRRSSSTRCTRSPGRGAGDIVAPDGGEAHGLAHLR